MTRLADLSRQNYAEAAQVASLIGVALSSLHDSRGGYSATVPGAAPSTGLAPILEGPCPECGTAVRPCADHDAAVSLTHPERLAMSGDPAAAALAALGKAIHAASVELRRARNIVERWGLPPVNADTVARKLAAAPAAFDRDLWCRNCSRYGHHNPRREEKTECEFCSSFRLDYGVAAPARVLKARDARGGRIYRQDIERILDAEMPGWRKKARTNTTKKGKK